MATNSRGITIVKSTRTALVGSDVRNLCIYLNRLARAVSMMMPGVLLSDPALKTGTTSAKTLRAEAFHFMFRGNNIAAAAQEKAFTATTHDVAASKQAWFALSTQVNGTSFTITKAADQTIGTDVYPTAPDNEVVIGYLKIVTGVTGFDATTDDLSADGARIASLTFVDDPAIALVGDESSVEITA